MPHDGHDTFSWLNFWCDLNVGVANEEEGSDMMVKLWTWQYAPVANFQPRSLTSESYVPA
ncbi:hypothetical protein [Proteus mirabilis]|uniref:hypothetical protein n=1 Tax=Proteus mirabilis TaxID=584 RepID=UPI0021BAB85A|nr:hypothetical protein [Proteus mirabilis]